VPLGFAAASLGAPRLDGRRTTEATVLRSGVPYAGLELGRGAVWAVGAASQDALSEEPTRSSGRLVRLEPGARQAQPPPLLSVPDPPGYQPEARSFAPAPASWGQLATEGAGLARLTVRSPTGTHALWVPVSVGPGPHRLPDSPAVGGEDPAVSAQATWSLTVFDLGPLSAAAALSLPGPDLAQPAELIFGYSRARSQ
jgi:hypothetical protein